MNKPTKTTGFLLVIIGATCWGVGGTVSQRLFQEHAVEVDWLVTVRLLIAGLLLLLVQSLKKGSAEVFAVWKNKKAGTQLVIFGLLGMLAVQYTYMASIHHGNAAVATLLQYLAPVMIIIYLLVRRLTVLTGKDTITAVLALTGCFFLLTNGSLSALAVPAPAVIWGVLSGAALAFYTLYAVPLLKQFNSLVVVGWAMIIGGGALSFIHPPWQIDIAAFTPEMYAYLFFIVIFGTMIAFWFYIESLQSLAPQETSLLGSLEPLSAVFTMVLWLGEPFGGLQWFGTVCIIGMTFLLAFSNKTSLPEEKNVKKSRQAG
ncbi:EamA family transporter [Alkalicoccus halolimnae]|uniref:EamA family transporter n=1 Tax=Alkalicoccus halolimnae TaxID=1667239 RepID=A0A5C7F2W9_9BACI|nr:EamA family transporter [Alkalicoccus halolimnae]TXF81441.1 EamA family transporter [Alkalicoccus halolimnae]